MSIAKRLVDGARPGLVIDRDNNRLYELFNATCNPDGSWDAACGAVFHLDSNNVRPAAQPGWTSADAAGMAIFPGLVRYDEARRGVVSTVAERVRKPCRRLRTRLLGWKVRFIAHSS